MKDVAALGHRELSLVWGGGCVGRYGFSARCVALRKNNRTVCVRRQIRAYLVAMTDWRSEARMVGINQIGACRKGQLLLMILEFFDTSSG